jgi:hypothetical protein
MEDSQIMNRLNRFLPHMSIHKIVWTFALAVIALTTTIGRADDDDDKAPTEGRYFFDLLDYRSHYNKDFFVDSFLGPQLDGGSEFEFDYLHGEKRGVREDEVDAEAEWNFSGQWTMVAELGWSSEHEAAPLAGVETEAAGPERHSGLENLDLAVFHPIFQYVSPDGRFDYTAEARVDVGVPTRGSSESQDVVLKPYFGQLLRLGEHISLEAWTGTGLVIAPHPPDEFLYGACLAYVFPHHSLPIPGTDRVAPQIEIDGQTPMTSRAKESLFGVAGFDLSLQKTGKIQPHIAIGYEFPIDQGARDQLHWAILVQLEFDF